MTLTRTAHTSTQARLPGSNPRVTTASFTPPNNSLLVVHGAAQKDNAAGTNPLTSLAIVNSAGLTFTEQAARGDTASAFGTGIKIWTAPVTTGVSMTVGLNTSYTPLDVYLSVVSYTGHDAGSPVGVLAAEEIALDGADSITLSGAPAATSEIIGGRTGCLDLTGTIAATPATGHTEVHDIAHDDESGLQVQVRDVGSTSTQFSWADVQSAGGGAFFTAHGVAIEIKDASGGTTTPKSVDGSITTAGALDALVAKALTGANTPAGQVDALTAKRPAGSITPAGQVDALTAKRFTGAITPTGQVDALTAKRFSGAITPAAVLTRAANRAFAGAVTPAGTITRRTSWTRSGTLVPAGAVDTQVTYPVTGTLIPTGTVRKTVSRGVSGAITPDGTIDGSTGPAEQGTSGTIAPTGTLTTVVGRAYAGAATPAGAITRGLSRRMAAGLVPGGTLERRVSASRASTVQTAGSFSRFLNHPHGGAVTLTGTLTPLFVAAPTIPVTAGAVTTMGSRSARARTGTPSDRTRATDGRMRR
jgi:hypothetical protein